MTFTDDKAEMNSYVSLGGYRKTVIEILVFGKPVHSTPSVRQPVTGHDPEPVLSTPPSYSDNLYL
jgi:hypothetical protein